MEHASKSIIEPKFTSCLVTRVAELMGRRIYVFCRLCHEEKREDLPVVVLPEYRRYHLRFDHDVLDPPKFVEPYYDLAEVAYFRRHHEPDSKGGIAWKPHHPDDAKNKRLQVLCLECEKEYLKDVVVLPGYKKKHLMQHHKGKVKDLKKYDDHYELALVKYYRRYPEDEWDKTES